MKRLYLTAAFAAAVVAGCADTTVEPTAVFKQQYNQSIAADRYLVSFNGNVPGNFAQTVAKLGGSVEMTHAAGIGVVTGLTAEAAATLRGAQGISDVLPDLEISVAPVALASDAIDAGHAIDAGEAIMESQANPTTAVRYSFQWNMRQIGADKAWAAGKLGSKSVSVAILDTGLDYLNRDLTGLVDLARSKSFVPADADTLRRYFGPSWHEITDLQGHGTNVAAQVSSIAFATAGITSKTTLIGVKVLGQNGSGSLTGILNGVLHSADVDADVVNMSLGVRGGWQRAHNGRYLAMINRVFTYAHRQGTLVIVSAGNDAADMDHDGNTFRSYCGAPNVICVAATGPTGFTGDPYTGPRIDPTAPAPYTNFGRSAIDLAAPGGSGGGFVWSFCARHAIYPFYASAENPGPRFPCTGGGNLIGMAGTSQAAPHVAGLAALLVAEYGRNVPSTIKEALLAASDDLGAPGTDPFYGKGHINVAKALGL